MTKEIFTGRAFTNGAHIRVAKLENGMHAWVVDSFEEDTYFDGNIITVCSAPTSNPSDLVPVNTYDDFVELFEPVENLNREDDGNEYFYKTYGEDLEHVKKVYAESPMRVWTVVDENEFETANPCIVAWFQGANRLAYIITKQERVDNYMPRVEVA